MINYSPCPECESKEIEIEHWECSILSGYSIFNKGKVFCKTCNFTLNNIECSCNPEMELKEYWNKYTSQIKNISNWNKVKSEEFIKEVFKEYNNVAQEIMNKISKEAELITCGKCQGVGRIVKVQGFHRTQVGCINCQGTGKTRRGY